MWTPEEVEDSVTDEELVSMVEEIEEEGFIDEEKKNIKALGIIQTSSKNL